MKRRLAIAAVCLVLGAIVNVLVAWGLGLWSPTSRQEVPHPVVQPWPCTVPDGWPEVSGLSVYRGIGIEFRIATGLREEQLLQGGAPSFCGAFVYESGWPVHALGYTSLNGTGTMPGGTNIGCLSTRAGMLPLVPLWPGIVINAVFYGVLLWLAGLGFASIRRARRRRRGRCAWCGYELAGLEQCPECGKER